MRQVIVKDKNGTLWYVSAESSKELVILLASLVSLRSKDAFVCSNNTVR